LPNKKEREGIAIKLF